MSCSQPENYYNNYCQETFAENLYSIDSTTGDILMNEVYLEDTVIPQLSEALDSFFQVANLGEDIPGFDASVFIDVCRKFPAGCYNYLTNFCSHYDGTSVAGLPVLRSFCGCFVDTSCSLLCLNYQTVPRAPKSNNYQPIECKGNLCVISIPSLNTIRSTNNITTVNNVCDKCTHSNPCVCEIYSSSSKLFGREISYDIEQKCSGDSVCYETVGGVRKKVPCESKLNTDIKKPVFEIPTGFYMIVGAAIIFFFVFLYLSLSSPIFKAKVKKLTP